VEGNGGPGVPPVFIIGAANGALALDLLRQTTPQVILLDTRMPVMDGRAFARAYHEQAMPHAPIIVLTAAADADAIADEIKADAVLQKPFDLDDLLRLVGRFSAPPSPTDQSSPLE
jgi:CheY-like chemotaxis protein